MIWPPRDEPLYRLLLVLCALLAPIMWGTPACAPQTPVQSAQNDEDFRIATLSPSLGLILEDLGLAHHIVGRHGFDTFLDPSIPVVGDQAGIDYEQLARAQPTHVLLEWGTRELPTRLQSIASKSDWLVEDFTLLGLDDLPQTIDKLGVLFDTSQTATELQQSLHDALAPLDPPPPQNTTVLPMYWTSPLGIAGPGSFHAQLLTRLGLPLAQRTGPAYLEMEAEDLARLDPTIIILFVPNADQKRIDEMLAALSSLRLGAVAHNRVIVIDDPTCLSLSARVIPIANKLREKLREMAFEERDP